jgi:alanyl-tRNA synthetase
VAVTKDLTPRFHAGKIIGILAPIIGGSGGGKPDLAQAGGSMVEKLDNALKKVRDLIG